jgi:hypothetical protein
LMFTESLKSIGGFGLCHNSPFNEAGSLRAILILSLFPLPLLGTVPNTTHLSS